MFVRSFCVASLIMSAGFLVSGTAAEASVPVDICRAHTTSAERHHAIPDGLLGAISLAESGQWDARAQESRAWPWTVMARGEGTHHVSKQAALAQVAQLQTEGVTNIDVGCMQVNLGYHGHQFASVADAMDPRQNVAYAAQFLLEKRAAAETWMEAASHYHSRTPHLAARYRAKVERLWANIQSGSDSGVQVAGQNVGQIAGTWGATVQGAAPQPVTIDYTRTARLNDSLRKRRAAARAANASNTGGNKPADQLTAWRMAVAAQNNAAASAPTGNLAGGTHFQGLYGQVPQQGQSASQSASQSAGQGGLTSGAAESGPMASLNAANAAQIAALIRRAELAAQEKAELRGGTRNAASFAAKRKSDLAYWRQSNGLGG